MSVIVGMALTGCSVQRECVVIAHRGASGHMPEHTVGAYAMAYGMGADVIEPDLVLTRDGVLVCSHDVTIHNEAAAAARFPDQRRADGKWYIIDFDLAELRSLGAPLGRNSEHGAGMGVVTFDEMISLVQRLNTETGRGVEIVPEAKAPKFHRDAGQPIEGPVVAALARAGYTKRTDGAIIQCFDLEALKRMRHELGCELRLVYVSGEPITEVVFDEVASFADGIGPSRKLIEEDDGTPGKQPGVIEAAQRRGLSVYVWTFGRDETLVRRFMRMEGVTGVFTDYPDVALRVRGK